MLAPHLLAKLAAAAVVAPSADNRHEFTLEASGNVLRFVADAALRSAHPRRQRLALFSAGAAVENVILRGASLGIRLAPSAPPRFHADGILAELAAAPMTPAADPLEAAIEARHTNRRLQFKGPVPAGALRAMQDAAAGIAGQRLALFDTPARRQMLSGALWRAERERFRHEELHEELYEAVRLDLAPGAPAARGIPALALELNPVERAMFALLRRWPLQRMANLLAADAASAARSVFLPCRWAPHVGAIVSTGPADEASLLAAGRALQRAWLAAEAAGLSFQVFAALALYAGEGLAPVDATVRRRLSDALKALEPDGTVQIFFRFGFAKPPSQRSTRPSAEGIVAQAAH